MSVLCALISTADNVVEGNFINHRMKIRGGVVVYQIVGDIVLMMTIVYSWETEVMSGLEVSILRAFTT